MRFDRATIEAVVAEGRLSHPGAAEALFEALLERRRLVGETWLEAVSPLDAFAIEGERLCGLDLGVYYELFGGGAVEHLPPDYRRELDDDDPPWDSGVEVHTVAASGRFCLPLPPADGYHVLRLRARRGAARRPPMQVHVVRDASGARVVGTIRVED
jgi:hypothetical protein